MSEGLRFADLDWVMGSTCSDPWKEANQRLGEGRVVEYRCFDAPKKEQGMAVFEVAGVSDETKHLLKGIHLSASDEYYQWYGEHDLTIDNTVYHVCSSSLAGCAFKLPRRDRRELIHLDQWRLVNPAILVSQDYSRDVGLARIRSAVMKFVPHPLMPPSGAGEVGGHGRDGDRAQGAIGAGLDEVMKQTDAFPPAPLVGAQGRGTEKRERGVRRSVGRLLNERAESHEVSLEVERKRKSKRKKKTEGLEKKKQSRGDWGGARVLMRRRIQAPLTCLFRSYPPGGRRTFGGRVNATPGSSWKEDLRRWDGTSQTASEETQESVGKIAKWWLMWIRSC